MTRRSRTLIFILLSLLLIGGIVVAFTSLYDPDYLKTLFLAQVERQLGRKIEVGEARLEIFPRIRLELSQVVIRDLDSSQVFLTADRFDLVLRAIPLLRQRVVGKHLTVERPKVLLRRNQEGQWNVLPPASPGASPSEGNPLSLFLLFSETVLVNGEVTVVDESQAGSPRTLRLGAVNIDLSVDREGYQGDLRVSASLVDAPTKSTFSLAGTLSQVQALVRIAPEDPQTVAPVLQFDGLAEATDVSLPYLAQFFPLSSPSSGLPRSASVRGHLKLVPGVVGYDMVLSEMSLQVESFSITGQASLSGLMTPQPTYAVTVASPQFQVEEVFDQIPAEWLSLEVRKELAEREVRGTVEVVSATVSGALAPDTKLSLNGEFRLIQGHALLGEDRTPVRAVAATVFLEPDRLRIADLTGFYGTMRVSGGRAILSFVNPGPWLELDVAGDMLAKDLIATLAGSAKPGNPWAHLKGLRDVQGGTLLTFRIVGPVNQPEEFQFVEGEIAIQEGGFRSEALPGPLAGLNGRIRFSEKGTEFDRVRGRMGQSQFEIQGATEAGQPSVFREFQVKIRGDAADVTRLLPKDALAGGSLQGTVAATLALSGSVEAPRLKGVVDLRPAGLTFPGILDKPIGARASVEFDGALPGKGAVTLTRVDLVMPPFRLIGKGLLRWGKVPEIAATVVSGPIAINGLPQGLTLGNLRDGILELSLDIKGKGHNWKAWQWNGWVAITDGLLLAKGIGNPIANLYLRMRLIKDGAELRRLAFRIRDSDIRVSGLIRNLNRLPTINLKVESSRLDLKLLIPEGERSPIRDVVESLAASSRLVGTVDIERGSYEGVEFTDLSSRVNIGKGVVDVDRIAARTGEGKVAGRLVARLPERKPADVEVTFRVTDFPFDQALDLAGDESRLIMGKLSVNGTIRGNGKNPRGVLHTISGQMGFAVKNGRIQKGSIVPKIINLLNLPNLLQGKVDLNQEGFPFDKITGDISIRNGLVTENNLVVDSPVMKMSAAGTYDMTTNQLDVIMVTSPLGSYSQLLKSIPLFGRLFKGERHGLDTALFEVKGPIQDPSVRYLAIESLGTGLFGVAQLAYDVLKNTILLPKELIAPSPATPEASDSAPADKGIPSSP